MFLRFFRSSFATQYLVIGVTGLLLWGKAFVFPAMMPPPEGPVPLYSLIFSELAAFPRIATVIGFIIALCSAFVANYILVRNEIISKNSSLAGFLFIIFISFFPALLILNPAGIVLLLLLLIVNSLFDSYNKSESPDLIYLSGFLVGIGSFIYFPFLAFYGFILVALVLFRSSNWREWLSSLIGLATPYVFLAVWYFWFDELIPRSLAFVHSFRIYLAEDLSREPAFLLLSGFIVFLMISGWLNSVARLSEKTIEIRKKTIILNWLVLFVIVSFAFGFKLQTYHSLLVAGSSAILMAIYLLQLKKSLWQEAVIILLLLSILISNYLVSG